jgi:hypothetical protein
LFIFDGSLKSHRVKDFTFAVTATVSLKIVSCPVKLLLEPTTFAQIAAQQSNIVKNSVLRRTPLGVSKVHKEVLSRNVQL